MTDRALGARVCVDETMSDERSRDRGAASSPRFRAIFDAELPYVIRTLRRLGVPESDVEDLAQEVFVAVSGRVHEYDPARPVRPWLFAFACRLASNHRRLARHRLEQLDPAAGALAPDDGPSPTAGIERQQRRALLLRALEYVPFERRAVVVMHDLDEMTAAVIADTLGLPVNTVYSRLRIGRAELEKAVLGLRSGKVTR